jgi:hypothetical protein
VGISEIVPDNIPGEFASFFDLKIKTLVDEIKTDEKIYYGKKFMQMNVC